MLVYSVFLSAHASYRPCEDSKLYRLAAQLGLPREAVVRRFSAGVDEVNDALADTLHRLYSAAEKVTFHGGK